MEIMSITTSNTNQLERFVNMQAKLTRTETGRGMSMTQKIGEKNQFLEIPVTKFLPKSGKWSCLSNNIA